MQGILQLIRKAKKIGSVRPQKAYKFVETADNINSKAHKANSRKDYQHLIKVKPGCQTISQDRDCSEQYCLLTARAVDGRFSTTEYSQLQVIMVTFAFLKRNQLEFIENPHGSSSETK